jgi:hypothetical protein
MRVYRLVKKGQWMPDRSVAQNLADNSDLYTKEHFRTDSEAWELSKKQKIKYDDAKKVILAVKKTKSPQLKEALFNTEKRIVTVEVKKLSNEQTNKVKIRLFEAMERAYDLGKRGKILSMDEKRKFLNKIIEGIET